MPYTDDPISDFLAHDREQAREIERLPVCDYCDNAIQDEHYYDIEGEILCESCLIKHFRKSVDDYEE